MVTPQQLTAWAYMREARLAETIRAARIRRDNRRARDRAARARSARARLTDASRARYLLTLARVRHGATAALNTAIAEQAAAVRDARRALGEILRESCESGLT